MRAKISEVTHSIAIYTGQADIGFCNRYAGVHPYFFIESMVDPRTKGMLTKMMTKDQYTKLKSNVIEFMFEAKKEMAKAKMTANVNAAVSSSTQSAEQPRSTTIDAEFEDDDDLFGGLEDNASTAEPELPLDEAELRSQCEVESDHFLKDMGQQMRKENKKEYNDPLRWWEENQHKYPVVAAWRSYF